MVGAPLPRLALGTAQFGLPYGLGRPDRPVPPGDVKLVLSAAWSQGVDMLDTAADYGDAEEVIGAQRSSEEGFQVVSKTASRPGEPPALAFQRARRSLERLKVDALYALLTHDTSNLLGSAGAEFLSGFECLREEGIAVRLGVSVYEPEELMAVLRLMRPDVVQLPLNVLDQRFATSGLIERLADLGVEVHVRSVFLQGILVRDFPALPAPAAAAYRMAAEFRAAMGRIGYSPVLAALLYVLRRPGVSRIIVGVDGLRSLCENIGAYRDAVRSGEAPDFARFAARDFCAVDPRRWN